MSRYLNSECSYGYLHKFKIISSSDLGLVERCERCGTKMFFPSDTPNWKYLEYHVREVLTSNDPRFTREYPHIKL